MQHLASWVALRKNRANPRRRTTQGWSSLKSDVKGASGVSGHERSMLFEHDSPPRARLPPHTPKPHISPLSLPSLQLAAVRTSEILPTHQPASENASTFQPVDDDTHASVIAFVFLFQFSCSGIGKQPVQYRINFVVANLLEGTVTVLRREA